MASTIRYFVSGTGSNLLDLRDPLSQYSLTGQSIVATGSGLVNTVYAAPGVDLDARGLLGGSDVVFFNGTTATTASVVGDSNGNSRSEVVVGGVNYDVYTSALDISVHLLVNTSLTTAVV